MRTLSKNGGGIERRDRKVRRKEKSHNAAKLISEPNSATELVLIQQNDTPCPQELVGKSPRNF